MNKKLRNGLALCLAVLMLATVLAGCGGSGDGGGNAVG